MVFEELQQRKCSGRKRKHKREDSFNYTQEGSRLKETQVEEDLNKMDPGVESMDLISQLPDHVIHNIFSQIRNVKDVIRMSVLSKRWRSLWHSFSVLTFDERRFITGIEHVGSSNKEREKTFREYVFNSLQTHLEKNLHIQKLVLHMTSIGMPEASFLDLLLSVAINRNIKELDLCVSKHYSLPQYFSSKTMTGLRLSGCTLEACHHIMLPHLQKLYLRKISLAGHIVQSLFSNCPSIEDLRFIQCSGLKHLQVSNLLELNRVEIHHCNQLKRVDLTAPHLHTFWYCGKKSTTCKLNFEDCHSLRRLTLEHPQVTPDFCEKISQFSLLEKLDLSIPNKLTYVKISNPQLRRLVLKGWNRLGCIIINAPNLLSFEYKDETMPYIHILPLCLTNAKLSFEPKGLCHDIECGDEFWFLAREFIKMFNPKGFKLVIRSNKNVVIHENLNNIRLPPLPNLSFEIIKSSASTEDILYGLLRTLHPVSLSIISPPDSKFPMSLYEMIKNKDKDPICCQYNSQNNKCWRHFLKDVKFEDLKDEDKGTPNCIWHDWLMSSYASLQCQMTNLRLYWNSRH